MVSRLLLAARGITIKPKRPAIGPSYLCRKVPSVSPSFKVDRPTTSGPGEYLISNTDTDDRVRHHLCYSPPSSPESNSSQPATPVTSLEQLVRQDGYEWTTDEIVDAVLAVFPGVRVIENGSPKVRSMRLLDGLGIDKSARGSHYPSSRKSNQLVRE